MYFFVWIENLLMIKSETALEVVRNFILRNKITLLFKDKVEENHFKKKEFSPTLAMNIYKNYLAKKKLIKFYLNINSFI